MPQIRCSHADRTRISVESDSESCVFVAYMLPYCLAFDLYRSFTWLRENTKPLRALCVVAYAIFKHF